MNVLASFYQRMSEQMQANFGGDDGEQTGMDPSGFMMDMPLSRVINMLGSSIPTSPEEMVTEMLAKVYKSPNG